MTTEPNIDSKLMARRFSLYQALPLAWYDLPDEAYCLRLEHVHSPKSSAPTSRGICLELRGHRGFPAVLLAEVDHVGVKWTTKMVSASDADELLKLISEAHLLSPPAPEKPRYISSFTFGLELRLGQQYQFIRRQAPSDDTASRRLEGFFAVVQRLVELAEVPSSEVFYGESQTSK